MTKLAYSATDQSRVSSPQSPMDLAKVLVATHDKYDEFVDGWEKFLNVYQGYKMGAYIFKHLRESTTSVQQRVRRAYFLNYCAPVVDLYAHYIFSKSVVRKSSNDENAPQIKTAETNQARIKPLNKVDSVEGSPPEEWETWLENVDRKKNGIDRFMARAARFAFALGHVYVLVDMPKADGIQTEQQRKDQKIEPYLVMYYPQDLVNFGLDEKGELLWARFKEDPPDSTDPFTIDVQAKINQSRFSKVDNVRPTNKGLRAALNGSKTLYYKTWTKDRWFSHKITSDGAELVAQGSHPCGKVPVVPIYNVHHSRFSFFGTSLLTDIADINVAIYNWSSLIDEEIYQKCLNILCISRVGAGQNGDSDEIIIGQNNALEYDGPTPPFYLAPATDPGTFIQTQIDRMRDEIFRIAKLGGGLGLEVPAQRSGVSAAFEFNETNRTIAEKADELETAEIEIHTLWHKWLNKEWDGIVDYPDNFSIESFETEVNLILQSRDAILSPTFNKELQKRAVKKILHNMEDEDIKKIEQEIEQETDEADAMKKEQSMMQMEQAAAPPLGAQTKSGAGSPADDKKKVEKNIKKETPK